MKFSQIVYDFKILLNIKKLITTSYYHNDDIFGFCHLWRAITPQKTVLQYSIVSVFLACPKMYFRKIQKTPFPK